MFVIKNVKPFINGKFLASKNIVVDNGIIIDIVDNISGNNYDNIIDGNNHYLVPGYIDIHTHGGYGHDVMEGTIDAIKNISDFHLENGTTTYIPTTLTADIPTTLTALSNVRNFNDNTTARRFGVHLEGPFLSKKAPGAHPPYLILEPNEENTKWVFENKDIVSRVTVAPDTNCADIFAKKCSENGIQVSIGHDASIDDEIYKMIENGASSVTHMYNCTSRPSRRTTPHKHLGLTEVGLIEDELICEVIADNRHVPNKLFSMIYRLKGADKIALVSDSLAIAGRENEEMYLGSGESKQRIVVEEGVAVIKELNTYAGSVTPIGKQVQNLHNNLGICLEDCITMATTTPCKLMNICDRGEISIGKLADFNIIDDKANIIHTILNGKLVK